MDAPGHKAAGNDFYRRSLFSKAIVEYTRAMKKDIENPIYVLNRSQAYLANKQYQEAFEDSYTFLCQRNFESLTLTSKAFYRMAMASRNLAQTQSLQQFLLSLSYSADPSSLSKDALYNSQKTLFHYKTVSLQQNSDCFSLFAPVSRYSMTSTSLTYTNTFNNNTLPCSIIPKATKGSTFVGGYGNHVFDLFRLLACQSGSNFKSIIHLIDSSIIHVIRTIVLLTGAQTGSEISLLFRLCNNPLLSQSDQKTFYNLLETLIVCLKEHQNKKELKICNSIILHSEPSSLTSIMYQTLKIWKANILASSKQEKGDENLFPNPFLSDLLTCTVPKEIPLPSMTKEKEKEWIEMLTALAKNAVHGNAEIHFWLGDPLQLLLEKFVNTGIQFNKMYMNYMVDSNGLWNVLPVCLSVLTKYGIIQTSTQFGSPASYKQMIAPMNCNLDDVDMLLSCIGASWHSECHGPHSLTVQWQLSATPFDSNENSEIVVKHVTRLLMRFSVSPVRPSDKWDELFDAAYQLPCHTSFTYLLCCWRAMIIHPGSGKHLVDLVLVSDHVAGRPFLKHRQIAMRTCASSLLPFLMDSFLSQELIIPQPLLQWRCEKVSPLLDIKHSTSFLHLCLLLVASHPLLKEAQAQIQGDVSKLFFWILSKERNQVQMIDQLLFTPESNFLAFLCPTNDFMMEEFQYAVVIDLDKYTILSKPIKL